MKIKTSELIGPALDWTVAKCEGMPVAITRDQYYAAPPSSTCMLCDRRYSTDWAQGGPIIEREKIAIDYRLSDCCVATLRHWEECSDGPTPLIAAMRCYVASKLGDEVEIPAELMP